MITELGKEELIIIGSRFSGSGLVEQGGYTIGIATAQGKSMAILLPPKYVDEVAAVREEVREAAKDREATEQESKFATSAQNEAIRKAKVWMRRAVRRAKRAMHMGKQAPDTLLKMVSNAKLKEFSQAIDLMVKDFEKYSANIPGSDNQALLTEGKALAAALLSADADQEVKKLSQLPQKVREYYYKKGLLYKGLKVINEAGRELFVNEPGVAETFNFKILYRNYTNHKGEPKKEETTPC
ncbi:hypothetical protein HY768_01920 [candidate division TA06 bacterium]|uniref:Uncharacterized protein n=1 Tax=candidate division TA06 bacterium TaxID=2250710 RepID=A0A933MK41_UNCT6|nr:hypothetical protein [candidate division TA06 bacterium]